MVNVSLLVFVYEQHHALPWLLFNEVLFIHFLGCGRENFLVFCDSQQVNFIFLFIKFPNDQT